MSRMVPAIALTSSLPSNAVDRGAFMSSQHHCNKWQVAGMRELGVDSSAKKSKQSFGAL
jgi:hypothetical protein